MTGPENNGPADPFSKSFSPVDQNFTDSTTSCKDEVIQYRRTGYNCENLIIANCEFF